MCNCVSNLTEQMKQHNTEFDKVVYWQPDRTVISTIQVAMKKINPRGRKPIRIRINYCPFCGEEWSQDATNQS